MREFAFHGVASFWTVCGMDRLIWASAIRGFFVPLDRAAPSRALCRESSHR